jgi:hypothetical protein
MALDRCVAIFGGYLDLALLKPDAAGGVEDTTSAVEEVHHQQDRARAEAYIVLEHFRGEFYPTAVF